MTKFISEAREIFLSIAEGPWFWGIIALLGFAATLTGKTSVAGAWVCISLAWVCVCASMWRSKNIAEHPHRAKILPAGIVFSGAVLVVYGAYIMPTPAHTRAYFVINGYQLVRPDPDTDNGISSIQVSIDNVGDMPSHKPLLTYSADAVQFGFDEDQIKLEAQHQYDLTITALHTYQDYSELQTETPGIISADTKVFNKYYDGLIRQGQLKLYFIGTLAWNDDALPQHHWWVRKICIWQLKDLGSYHTCGEDGQVEGAYIHN